MKLVPYNVEELKPKFYKKSDNYIFLMEFINSDLDCARVDNYTHKNAKSCSWSLQNTIRRYGLNGIQCIQRKGEVFLIKLKNEE